MSMLANHNAISAGGYTIQRSLRFRSAASAYLNRTPASASNRKTWTWSAWVKRGALGTSILFGAGSVGTDYTQLFFNSDTIQFNFASSGTNRIIAQSLAVFRDPSAWYHIVCAIDTTQATSSNGVKIYVNGTQQTLTISTYTQNSDTFVNNTSPHSIGQLFGSYFDGYLAEVNFIDGQALTPSSFGQTDVLTGVWTAKKYTGTYGNNGFYLPFTDTSSTTNLVKDSSGNGNNWTPNNISLTAGVTYDSMIDSPTVTASATQPVGNYCVLNPLNTVLPLSNANLTGTQSTAAWTSSGGTIAASSGKYYYEASMSTIGSGNYIALGLMLTGTAFNQYAGSNTNSWSVLTNSTNLSTYYNAVATNATTISASTSTAFQVAVDIDAGKLWLGYNNTWIGGGNPATGTSPTYTFTANSLVNPIISGYSNTVHLNCGQRPFTYTPPTGFRALCTTNLPDSTIVKGNQYMDAALYTGNGSNQNITGINFEPDIFWGKSRSSVNNHGLVDVIRGGLNALYSNLTNAETSDGVVTAWNSNGVSLGNSATTNANGASYVGWMWDAGSSTVTNTSGSISSQVRANTTSGVSIVTYTGTGANATVGHGLGVAPKMIIVKSRTSTVDAWTVWHTNLSATQFLQLNATAAVATSTTAWNSTLPSSTVFSVGNSSGTNTNGGTYVAYCFAEISGFSKAFSYTGNGSADGPMVYCGFLPKFILIKRSDTAGTSWVMYDSARNTYNVIDKLLLADTSGAEVTATSIDILSNGFKLRSTDGSRNASGGTYIGIAFASNPFKNSLAF